MTFIGDIAVPETGVRVINDPGKVINFLCDLPDNKYVFQLLKVFKEDGRPGKMIYRHHNVKMYMILLWKFPQWMEPEGTDNPAEVMLFVASSLPSFIKFFHLWFNKEQDNDHKNVIFDIQDMLYEHQKLEKEGSLQPQR